ncbi:dimethylsulfonioproprionate lyase family protein [Kiloniella sp.]|uniref:dimethylsulfonioproprionate lyase family protein n=1 Tax=Kiloniella sp. TaxID=1938587 RepID=UPI003B01FB25
MEKRQKGLGKALADLWREISSREDCETTQSDKYLGEILSEITTSTLLAPVENASLPAIEQLLENSSKQNNLSESIELFNQALERAKDLLFWYPNSVFEDANAAQETENYCCNLVGKIGSAQTNPFLFSSNNILCGLFYLGPNQLYPEHKHPAVELYVVLSGKADWKRGRKDWQSRDPGEYFFHASNQPHAMRTNDEPLLALWAWSGDIGEWASWVEEERA